MARASTSASARADARSTSGSSAGTSRAQRVAIARWSGSRGDRILFGRAQEELDALACAGVPVEVVPSVTAAPAAGALLQAPLTRRGDSRSVLFLTPRA